MPSRSVLLHSTRPRAQSNSYTRTRERERTTRFWWPLGIGGRQHDNAAPSCVMVYVGTKPQALTLLLLLLYSSTRVNNIPTAIDVEWAA